MNTFRGRLTPLGRLDVVSDSGCSVPEFLECQVLLRGYIADRNELYKQLGLSSVPQLTDAKLLAHAFRKWGGHLQAHVNGEYAAVILDTAAKTALITHDALGLMPVFFSHGAHELAFATHLADLVEARISDALDAEYFADYLVFGSVATDRTPFPSVKRLLPGQSVWWSGGELRQITSWNLADVPPLHCRDDREYEHRFRELLKSAVQSALADVGPTCISLSGGLDSSSIACIAAECGVPGLVAYSVVSPRWSDVDEQRWMQAVVDCCKLSWDRVDYEEVLPFSVLPAEFQGEPSQAVIDEKHLRFQDELLAARNITVMLTGHGGDTVLCASPGPIPTHLADSLFDGEPITALCSLRNWKNDSPEHRSYLYWLVRTLLQPSIDHSRARQIRGPDRRSPIAPWIKLEYARQMRLDQRARRQIAPRCHHPGRQSLWNSLWTIALAVTPAQQRRTSLELRVPLLYRPLVEFMCAIPWGQKLRPRCDRYLQRRALKGILPEMVRRRASKGSGNPALVDGLRRSKDWVTFLSDSPAMADLEMVDADRWRQAVRQASVGQTHGDRYFLASVAVEAWLKQLKERRKQPCGTFQAAVSPAS